jgi:signal transduction histidine kinase
VGLLCHAHFGSPRQWTEQEQTIAANLADYVQILYMAHQRSSAEEALRLNQQALAQAQKMEALGRLSSGIAHDFNNLLMVISGNAQMLERKTERGAAPDPRYLRNILDSCERAESLARKLLTIGRRSTGTPQWMELNTVVAEISRLLGPGLGPGIAMHLTPASTPVWVHADNDELQSALINLATNARDAMPHGGELHLSVEAADTASLPPELDRVLAPYVCLTVRDTGVGMPPEVMARAMEPFFTTKGPERGTGLGLWNVYNSMRSHHGHLAIDSALGRGTSVHLYLPFITEPPAILDAAAPTLGGGARAGRILLVDDDLAVQRTIADMLSFLGHQVTVCADGASAVERYRADPDTIDLVLLDLGMPGMPGDQCLRALRAIDPGCRCLVISGNITDQVANDCLRDGALGIVPKPFSLTACAQAVEKALAVTAV